MERKKDTVIWMGAGQIGLAIVRRIASGKKMPLYAGLLPARK